MAVIVLALLTALSMSSGWRYQFVICLAMCSIFYTFIYYFSLCDCLKIMSEYKRD